MAIPSARNYVVLDQNVIDVPEVVARLQDDYRRDGRRILLSHLARFEMTKGTADGFRKDITELARLPAVLASGRRPRTLRFQLGRNLPRTRSVASTLILNVA